MTGGATLVHSIPIALAAFGGGRLLATPGFARALVRGSESRSIEVLSRRLGEVARRYPALSQNILGFRDAVASGKVPDNAVTMMPEGSEVEAPAEITPDNPYAQYVQLFH